MKRRVLFWPVASGATVFFLWLGFCILVIGVPSTYKPMPRPGVSMPTYWSPAANLLNVRQSGTLARLLASVVTGLWRVAPWCRAPRLQPELGNVPHEDEVRILHYTGGRHMVLLVPRGDWTPYLFSIISVWSQAWVGLSTGEVLLYVFLLPGIHFAGALFVVGLLIAGVRALVGGLFPHASTDERDER